MLLRELEGGLSEIIANHRAMGSALPSHSDCSRGYSTLTLTLATGVVLLSLHAQRGARQINRPALINEWKNAGFLPGRRGVLDDNKSSVPAWDTDGRLCTPGAGISLEWALGLAPCSTKHA